MNHNKLSLVFAALAVFFWSTVATAFKIALSYQSPFQLLAVSVFVSTFLLFCILLFQRNLKLIVKINNRDWIRLIFLGFLNPYFYYKILFIAYSLLPTQSAQVINFIWPVLIVVFSIFLGYEQFSFAKILSLSVSFFGAFIVITGGHFSSVGDLSPIGAGLAFLSAFIWTSFWLINKVQKTDTVLSLFIAFLFGSVFILVEIFIFDKSFPISLPQFITAAYVGAFEMSITFVVWIYALKMTKSTALIGNLIYITPFISLIIIHQVLKEAIRPQTIWGLILIVSGIFLQLYFHYKETQKAVQKS